MEAVFVKVVAGTASTVTVAVTCIDCPTLKFPRLQTRSPFREQEGELESRITPSGSVSWTTTSLAFEGPEVVAVRV